MEQIITTIIATSCAVITALGVLVIAYLHKKTKQLEGDKKVLKNPVP
jgi:hypothetical protein